MARRTKRLSSNNKSKNKKEDATLFSGEMWALFGGVLAAVIALVGQWFIGRIYNGDEARFLIAAMLNSALYFGASVVTASATILALMLTMLSLTDQSKIDFDTVFFHRVEKIGILTTISLASSILLLLFLSIPVQESKNVPTQWFTTIYYVLIITLALLAGLLVTVVLMLLNAIRSLIEGVRPDDDDEDD
jgi:hypothetical protein